MSVSIQANGAFTANMSGCAITGNFVARPSGKNVFNMTLTFGAAPCTLPGAGASGVAVAYPLANGKTQLIVAGVNGARSMGTAAFGTR